MPPILQEKLAFRYDTKTEEEISEIQRKMIHECSDVLAIPHHDSLMLLQCFDWNLSHAQSSWYEDESRARARAGMRTSMTGDPLTLSRAGQCLLCKRICKPASVTAEKAPVEAPRTAEKVIGSTIKIVVRHLKKLADDSYDYNLPDESNPFMVDVTFPCRGLWAGLTASIRINISDKYPIQPPTVTYLTPSAMLHPNIDDSGAICIPILTPGEWSPTNNLSDVCEAMTKIFEIPDWGNVTQYYFYCSQNILNLKYSLQIIIDHALNGNAHELWTTKRSEFDRRLRSLGATGVISPSPTVLLSEKIGAETPSVDEDNVAELYSMECGHQFCVECWSEVIGAKSGPDLLVTLCPSKDCKLIIPEPVVARMSRTAYALYEDLKVKAYVAKDKKAKYCPNNCRRVCLYPKDRPSRKINCPCGHVWCWTCCNDPHYPISCKLLEDFNTTKKDFYGGKSYADDWAAANIKVLDC
jgi:ubiquitin-protein ligase